MGEVADAYTAMAGRYVELFGAVSSVHPDDLALIERHLTVEAGTVLDAGCGPGRLTAHLVTRGVDAIGLDLTRAFVEHARTTHDLDRFVVGTVRQLPIRDAAVSGILAWYSLIHQSIHEVDQTLTELRRIAVPGAPMVVGFFDGDRIAEFPHKVTTAHHWPIDELSRRLAIAGWTEIDRLSRPADRAGGTRAHGALVVSAS